MSLRFDTARKYLAELQPVPRAGEAEDIAKMTAFLIDDDQSGFVTGAYMPVDGGLQAAGRINTSVNNPLRKHNLFPWEN